MAEGPSRQLIDAFFKLSQALFAGSDPDALFGHLVEQATATVEGCDFASISLLGAGGRITTPAASHSLVVELDELQYRSGEGPCLEAVKEPAPAVYGPDLAHDTRWPVFGPQAGARGIGSLVSNKIAADGTVGALNLYSRRTDAFDQADRDTAYLLAIFAAVVVASSQARLQAANLQDALENRDVIGQAKGILMEREKVTADEAFEMLRRASQRLNRKLRHLAEDIATTGEEPPFLG